MRKNFFLIITAFLFSAAAIAQIPQLFKYQGLARDSSGNPISNDSIALRISIHQGTPTGTVVYKETHKPLTNEFGSFSINVGAGTIVTGNFSTIAWARNTYFQEVEMDITGGTSFVSMGTSQYLSVPYALATDSARKGIAPFLVLNTSTGGDTASVAIVAIANGSAPAIFCKNNGPGLSLGVDGNSSFTGNLEVNGNLYADSIGTINTTLVNGTQGNFSVGLTANYLTVNGNGVVLNVNGNGLVNGSLHVAGNLTKGSGSFKIDHPLDPTNKFLYHSFVESPDMKNIYDGTIMTDADGNASVELPAYFDALNRDFRYQLTAIGQFAQAIVAEEISNNKFRIKTDKPNVKISWQVTGIRKDAYAEKNRIVPEVEKNKDEKGKYLYPDSYEPNKN